MMQKKGSGLPWEQAVILIILGIVIILISPLISNIGELFASSGASSVCKISLLGQGTINCPVSEVNILSNKVEIDNKKFLEKGLEGTQAMAKEALAKLLANCLSIGGGYNSRAFSREDYASDEVVCLECFKVTIDENVGDIGGFTDYLRDTKSKGIDKKSYLESLTRDAEHLTAYMEFGMAKSLAPSAGTFVFKPNDKYTIFFMGIKKGEIKNIWGKINNIKNAEFLRLFFGNNDAYFAYAVESNKLNQVCDRKVN